MTTFLVDLVEPAHHLLKDANGFGLFKASLAFDAVTEVSRIAELGDQVGVVLSLEHIKQFEDVLGVEGLERVDLVLQEDRVN